MPRAGSRPRGRPRSAVAARRPRATLRDGPSRRAALDPASAARSTPGGRTYRAVADEHAIAATSRSMAAAAVAAAVSRSIVACAAEATDGRGARSGQGQAVAARGLNGADDGRIDRCGDVGGEVGRSPAPSERTVQVEARSGEVRVRLARRCEAFEHTERGCDRATRSGVWRRREIPRGGIVSSTTRSRRSGPRPTPDAARGGHPSRPRSASQAGRCPRTLRREARWRPARSARRRRRRPPSRGGPARAPDPAGAAEPDEHRSLATTAGSSVRTRPRRRSPPRRRPG